MIGFGSSNHARLCRQTPQEPRSLLRHSFLAGIIVLHALKPDLAKAEAAKIVGLGATSCAQYTKEVAENPNLSRDYFAWAQGLMSGFLLRTPPGKDERLELNPRTFPLLKQVDFLGAYCSTHPSEDFTDAVIALYKRLQREGTT